LGENGTGKDLFAKAIHNNSLRADKKFVSINCGAIPSDLLESELFGYEKGAYTGAVNSKAGRLEAADGGTIFLDEVTEMSITLQTKLLRVVQEKEIQRLGSLESKKIDVRFISATNKNIKELISKNLFREDLYYRLKVIEINLPTLSERKEDIEELADFFIEKYSEEKVFTLSNEVIEALEEYDWPGNVRELENIIQRCLALASDTILTLDDLPPEIISNRVVQKINNKTGIKTLSEVEKEFRKKYIRKVLNETKSKSEAAEVLGVNRSHFHKLLSQLDLY
jgi:two-component system response regulator AtoC